jgi:hypothetical protein
LDLKRIKVRQENILLFERKAAVFVGRVARDYSCAPLVRALAFLLLAFEKHEWLGTIITEFKPDYKLLFDGL